MRKILDRFGNNHDRNAIKTDISESGNTRCKTRHAKQTITFSTRAKGVLAGAETHRNVIAFVEYRDSTS